MKHVIVLLFIASVLSAQTPAQTPAPPVKLCMTYDINAGHNIPLPCNPSKLKAAAVKIHHGLHVAGEVAIGAVIVGVLIYSQSR